MEMDGKEKAEETPPRGNEWEVVSLTASTYAAAPGPEGLEPGDEIAGKNDKVEEDEAETSQALFMSRHFVFPPSQHENLPLVSEADITNVIKEHGDVVPDVDIEIKCKPDKGEEDWDIEGLTAEHEFYRLQGLDKKDDRLAIPTIGFDDGTGLQGLSLVEGQENEFGALHSEKIIGGSTALDEKAVVSHLVEQHGFDLTDKASSPEAKDGDFDESHLPCGAWWKRRAACFYAHAKEVNSFWSICIAAAVMGLVVLGHRWQQERSRVLHLKWQCSVGDAVRNG